MRCLMFSFVPVKRLSTQITSCPYRIVMHVKEYTISSKRLQRWQPMKPAPPHTMILFFPDMTLCCIPVVGATLILKWIMSHTLQLYEGLILISCASKVTCFGAFLDKSSKLIGYRGPNWNIATANMMTKTRWRYILHFDNSVKSFPLFNSIFPMLK